MFSLARTITRSVLEVPERSTIVVGYDSAGKSALVNCVRVLHDDPAITPLYPTIGQNISRFRLKGMQEVFWDLGGQKRIRESWRHYYADADAVVFVIDGADIERMDEAVECLYEVVDKASLPLALVLNKSDLSTCVTTEELEMKLSKVLELCKTRNLPIRIFTTCCIDPSGTEDFRGVGVDRLCTWLEDVLLHCNSKGAENRV